MSEFRILAQPRSYTDLVQFLAGRRLELGLTMAQLDEIAGLASGHSSKILGPSQTKRFGWLSFFLMLPELGCKIQIIEDENSLANRRKPEEAAAVNQARLNNDARQPSMRVQTRVFAHIGRLGNSARNKKLSAQERATFARKAAMARWRRYRARRKARRQQCAIKRDQSKDNPRRVWSSDGDRRPRCTR